MSPIFLLILSCLLFSIMAALVKFNSQFIHPIEQAFFRNFISIFILLPFVFKAKKFLNKKKNIKLLFLRGLFGGITMILLFCSYTLIPLSQAMAVSFSTPLFIYLGGIIFFKEKTSKFDISMLLIGFILTIIIIRPDLEIKLGTLLALFAALTHAVAGLLVKEISRSESTIILMFSMVILMSPITFLPSIYVWTSFKNLDSYLILFLIAVIATLGNYCWTRALSESNLTNLMPFDFSRLIFATAIGLIFFDEKVDFITIFCGLCLIICTNFTALKIKKNADSKTVLSNN